MAAHFEPVLSDWQPHHQQGGLPLVGTQESSDMLGLQRELNEGNSQRFIADETGRSRKGLQGVLKQ